MDNKQMVGGG